MSLFDSNLTGDIVNQFNDAVMPIASSIGYVEGFLIGGSVLSTLYATSALKPYVSGGPKKWMTGLEAWRKGLYGDPKKGIILGRYKGRLICYYGRNHIGIDGTTGTGKTACSFLATLLSNTFFSFIVFDQSGDLWKKTSGFRSTIGPVYQINPSLANSDCYNLLDDLPDNEGIIGNLSAILDPFFAGSRDDQKKTGGDPHWEQSPKAILPYIFLQVLYGDDPSKKNFSGVLEYMEDEEACFQDMVDNPRHPRCRQIGMVMLADNKPHRSSIMAMIYTALSIFRDDSIARMTKTSSFRISDLATHKNGPITLYLTAKSTAIKRMLPLYVAIEQMMKIHLMEDTEKTLKGDKKVRGVIIMDDEAQNTKRPSIDDLEVQRKFWIQSMFGYQSLLAMADLYGEPKLGLFRTKLSLRPTVGDKVAKRISEMSGTYKKKVISHSESHGKSSSRSRSWKIQDEPRLTVSDLERWPEFGFGLLTHTGKPAILETFDSERDPQFCKLIVPEYKMEVCTTVRSPWEKIEKPVIVTTDNKAVEKDSEENSQIVAFQLSKKDIDDISIGKLIMQRLTGDDDEDNDDSEDDIGMDTENHTENDEANIIEQSDDRVKRQGVSF